MNDRFEKTISTLGERVALAMRALELRHLPEIAWVNAMHPVFERTHQRVSAGNRKFQRREPDSLPRVIASSRLIEPEGEPPSDVLSGLTRERLRRLIGMGADAARVHTDQFADRFARGQNADAVTVGKDIYFRRGQFAPYQPKGFALLAHEATHVAESVAPNTAWRRADSAGIAEEERRALSRERQLMAPRTAITSPASIVFSSTPVAPSASSPTMRPMKAESDRVTELADTRSTVPSLDDIRRTLYRDILAQLRIDSERGA